LPRFLMEQSATNGEADGTDIHGVDKTAAKRRRRRTVFTAVRHQGAGIGCVHELPTRALISFADRAVEADLDIYMSGGKLSRATDSRHAAAHTRFVYDDGAG